MSPDTLPPADPLASFRLGDWLVDPRACQLVSPDGTIEKLRPQLASLLVCLAKRAGRIRLRDEIFEEVWPGQYIAESGLSRCIAELRQVLQDEAQQPRFIETIPKRGYRLIAPVVWLPAPAAVPAAAGAAQPIPGAAGTLPDAVVPSAPGAPAVATRTPGTLARVIIAVVVAAVVFAAGALIFRATRSRPAPLTERDSVLLADVSNSTGDKVFDDALGLALAVNLEQAPFLRILPQEAVRAALRRSGRSPDTRVVGPVALDICRREGAVVLLAGSIASLGSRYVVGLEAIACGSGESIGRDMAEAGSKEAVLAALDRAASRLRKRLGESRDSLSRNAVPLVQATTASFDALVALTHGDASRDRGRHEEALGYYRRAAELDPQFALAWARLGLTARNVNRREEGIPALRRAFDLRERVSQPERFFIEGLYHRFVAGDPEKAVETFRVWKQLYPGSPVPANYIAATLSDEMGEYEAAVAEAREAVRLAPGTNWPYNNLAQALWGSGRFGELKQVIGEAARRGLDDMSMHSYLLGMAFLEGDGAALERETRWGLDRPQHEVLWRRVRAMQEASAGRLAEARRWLMEASQRAGERNGPAAVAGVHIDMADIENLLGEREAARGHIAAALSRDRSSETLPGAAVALAMAGDEPGARALLPHLAQLEAADPARMRVWLAVVEAALAAREGRGEDALRILQPISRFEKGNDFVAIPLYVRGMAAASAARPSDAAAAFGEFVRLHMIGWGPWLPAARLGLARGLRDAGDRPRSLAAYDALLESWKQADRDLALLKVVARERQAVR